MPTWKGGPPHPRSAIFHEHLRDCSSLRFDLICKYVCGVQLCDGECLQAAHLCYVRLSPDQFYSANYSDLAFVDFTDVFAVVLLELQLVVAFFHCGKRRWNLHWHLLNLLSRH